jgi:hypothetical protein
VWTDLWWWSHVVTWQRMASLVPGTVWALWHWPRLLMMNSYIGEAFPFGSAVFWGGWVLPTVAYSGIYTWIYNRTERSVLSAIVVLASAIALVWGPSTLNGNRRGSAGRTSGRRTFPLNSGPDLHQP